MGRIATKTNDKIARIVLGARNKMLADHSMAHAYKYLDDVKYILFELVYLSRDDDETVKHYVQPKMLDAIDKLEAIQDWLTM